MLGGSVRPWPLESTETCFESLTTPTISAGASFWAAVLQHPAGRPAIGP